MDRWSVQEVSPSKNGFVLSDVHRGTTRQRIRAALAEYREGLVSPPDLPIRLQNLVETVHDRPFDRSLNVSMVKALSRIRDNNVSSEFRYRFGMSIREYIEALRLGAVAYLKARGVPITMAAQSAGFSSVQTYYRARARRDSRSDRPLQINCEADL